MSDEQRTISKDDHLKLLGLSLLLQRNLREQGNLKDAVAGIVGSEKDEYGYYDGNLEDWVYADTGQPVEKLLSDMSIEVVS